MTAPNHAITGALIGLSVANPWLALPLAFLSHFVLDMVPHYSPPGDSNAEIIGSRRFWVEQIAIGGLLCFLIVLMLVISRPTHWLLAAICAFLAASPDTLFVPRFLFVRRTGKDNVDANWFWHFHHRIQWFQKPIGIAIELPWFVITGALLVHWL